MAAYPTHITYGALTGGIAALGTASTLGWDLTSWSAAGAATLALGVVFGLVGGMLPDIDHDRGSALRELTALLSTVLPVILVMGLSGPASRVGTGGLLFLLPVHFLLHRGLRGVLGLQGVGCISLLLRCLIATGIVVAPFYWFGAAGRGWPPHRLWGLALGMVLVVHALVPLFRILTVHRGLCHSVPAAVIYGEVAFLFLSGTTTLSPHQRLVVAVAAGAGALSHLVLDELLSVDFDGRLVRTKRSLGSALKLWDGRSQGRAGVLYGVAGALGVVVWFLL